MQQIRKAYVSDISAIMEFIEQNWKSDYILARDRAFFEWQFVDGEDVHFIIAEDNGQIVGIQGYIPYSSCKYPDIAGSILKVKKTDNPMLGIEIVDQIEKFVHHRWCASPGLSSRAIKLEKLKGYEIPKLNHFYWLNEEIEEYGVAVINKEENIKEKNYIRTEVSQKYIYNWKDFEKNFSPSVLEDKIPLKDMKYIKHRYFDHPIYKYFIVMIGGEILDSGYYVLRELCLRDKKIAKIVDYFGNVNMIAMSYNCLKALIEDRGYEYIDFYNYGIEKTLLFKGGFRELKADSKNVIPNYFEPFVQSNVEIYFSRPKVENMRLFIGDGDQDRPSIPRKEGKNEYY